jgi:hypothetical protein
MKIWVLSFCLITCLSAPAAARGQEEVTYSGGLLTVRCNEVPLAQLFEQINAAAGIELILEDSVKTTRLTANIEAQPPHLALERLLAGSGVNYAMSFDPQDWTRVTKIFIGSGGESPAPAPQASSSRTPVRRRPVRRAAPADEYQEEEDFVEEEEPAEEELPEEFDPEAGFETPETPSNTSPRPPSYPRSPFTPGLESNPFGNTNPENQPAAQPQQEGEADNPPPAYYPFLDPFGRPIPVPPGAQPQQKKKNPQNP